MANVILPLEHLQAMRSAKVQLVLCKCSSRPICPSTLSLGICGHTITMGFFVFEWEVVRRREEDVKLDAWREDAGRKANNSPLLVE